MQFPEAQKFAQALGFFLEKPDSKGWAAASCPLAPWKHQSGRDRTPSFRLKIGPQSWAHCFGCQWKGSPTGLILQFKLHGSDVDFKTAFAMVDSELDSGPLVLHDPTIFDDTVTDVVFPESWLGSFKDAYSHDDAKAYLKSRFVGPGLCDLLDLRYDSQRSRVCFPTRDYDGVLRGMHGRSINDANKLKYLAYTYNGKSNPDIWTGEHWLDPDKPVVIAESVFDMASILRLYRNVITPRSANMSDGQLVRLKAFDCMTMVSFFDGDKAGNMARNRLAGQFQKSIVLKHICPPEGTDAGEMDLQQLWDALQCCGAKLEIDSLLT